MAQVHTYFNIFENGAVECTDVEEMCALVIGGLNIPSVLYTDILAVASFVSYSPGEQN